MVLSSLWKKIANQVQGERSFEQVVDEDGINLITDHKLFSALSQGQGSMRQKYQYSILRMLEEEESAEPIANGFSLDHAAACALDDDLRHMLDLPSRFSYGFSLDVQGQTFSDAFSIGLIPRDSRGDGYPHYYKRVGSVLYLEHKEDPYLLDPAAFSVFKALENYHNLPLSDQDETARLFLIRQIQQAKANQLDIDLKHFNDLPIYQPDKMGMTSAFLEDGSLQVTPHFRTGVSPEEIQVRLGQLNPERQSGSLRVGNQIIVLDEKRLKATYEVLSQQHIPKERVKAFFESPSAFFDSALVDLDTGFSVRVKGAARYEYVALSVLEQSGMGWFNQGEHTHPPEVLQELVCCQDDLENFETLRKNAEALGASTVAFLGEKVDISQPEMVEEVLGEIKREFSSRQHRSEQTSESDNDEKNRDQEKVRSMVLLAEEESHRLVCQEQIDLNRFNGEIDFSRYARTPYPHQEEGVRWFLGRTRHLFESSEGKMKAHLHGALLADDMGLGKTYMSLVGIGEIFYRLQQQDKICKPVLVVAPLSLLENWQDEVGHTFKKSPFRDIVTLQGRKDLRRFKVRGAKSETVQSFDTGQDILDSAAIRYALKIGKNYPLERLDQPRRLVLVTYQTLRSYQFSLCRVDWSVVIFDEAQNIKNINTLQTKAAKGLKADFKLLVTGTPVENSLADFWCLMDTAQPALLGDWKYFRDHYIQPVQDGQEEQKAYLRQEYGRKLRADVGAFMLRRTKEEQLDGLPEKRIYTGLPDAQMPDQFLDSLHTVFRGAHRDAYDEVVNAYHQERLKKEAKGAVLADLLKLRLLSLHPDFTQDETHLWQDKNLQRGKQAIARSDKLQGVLAILDKIRARQEKVIIFLWTKKIQRIMQHWLQDIYPLLVIDIINGDTQPVASRGKKNQTRKGIIQNFEAQKGFAILIMSPVAAGVGLTVVGANHVIHLERHWNPAKEAQATDRVYRIGQKKEVSVYYPMIHHKKMTSFDVNLDQLLRSKSDIKDAVVIPQEVTPERMNQVLCEESREARQL
ncbi:DEAD/DEAH box helicase [Magnetococcales bacterium HHB-1]